VDDACSGSAASHCAYPREQGFIFCLTQFRSEGYGEAAEPNPFALFLELL